MTPRPAFDVLGQLIPPGKVRRIEMPASRLPSGAEVSVPLVVVHGRAEGPTLWISAAIHGDELNGVEVIRRILARVDPKEVGGTLLAVPILNVYGFAEGSRYLPDRRDLNRSFPGSARGSLASRLAHLFVEQVMERSEVGIDLHTGAAHRTNVPQVRVEVGDERAMALARVFGAPVLVPSALRDGSLRAEAAKRGKPCLLFEGGEASRFDRGAIEVAEAGVLRVMAELGMIDPAEAPASTVEPFLAKASRWVRAGRAGLFHLDVSAGDAVEKDAPIGRIEDVFGGRPLIVRSPCRGLVVGSATNPVVYRGDGIVHVAEG
jgi:predicted deacylase